MGYIGSSKLEKCLNKDIGLFSCLLHPKIPYELCLLFRCPAEAFTWKENAFFVNLDVWNGVLIQAIHPLLGTNEV